jgi:serine/threonine-protein kinase RsbW
LNTYSESIPSSINRIEDVVAGVLGFVEKSNGGLEESIKFDLKVVLNELVLNAVKHGNREDETKFVKVYADIENGEVCITVQDEGRGFDYESLLSGDYDNGC